MSWCYHLHIFNLLYSFYLLLYQRLDVVYLEWITRLAPSGRRLPFSCPGYLGLGCLLFLGYLSLCHLDVYLSTFLHYVLPAPLTLVDFERGPTGFGSYGSGSGSPPPVLAEHSLCSLGHNPHSDNRR